MKMRKGFQGLTIALSLAILAGSCTLPSAPAGRYAILIGVTNYQNVGDLNYPADDVASMDTTLASAGWVVESALTDSQATKAMIRDVIAGLAEKLDSNSSVLVYFSGHGIAIDGEAYIAPYDTSWPLTTSSLVSSDELKSWIKALDCENSLMIIDACYSGAFVETSNSIDVAPPNFGPGDQGTEAGKLSTALDNARSLLAAAFSGSGDPAILTISAAGAEEQSYDDFANKHGAFTWYLLNAASDASADGDGNHLVTAVEAYSYAKTQLKANWNAQYWQVPDGGMYMDFLPHISGGSADIVLYDLR